MSGGMKLGELDFKRLLPAFMRDDGAVHGLALSHPTRGAWIEN